MAFVDDLGASSPSVTASAVCVSLLTGAGVSDSAVAVVLLAVAALLGLLPCARLALRRRPLNPPDFLPSPSVPSASDVVPTFFSFFEPMPKNDERRLALEVSGEVGEAVDVAAGAFSAAAVGSEAGAEDVTSLVGAMSLSLTGSESWGAVGDTAAGSESLVGLVGEVSLAVTGEVGVSFLLKRLPNIEFLLLGFDVVSRAAVLVVVVSETGTVGSASLVAAVVFVSFVDPSGTTGSPITREAQDRSAATTKELQMK